MANRKNINFHKLVQITIEFLISENLVPDELTGSCRGEDNKWGKLCTKFFGSYRLKDSLYISTAWKRDMESYKTRVKDAWFERSKKIITLSTNEKNELKDFIQTFKDGRKNFSSKFTSFISRKLQNLGLKCWLSCKSNWFRKEGSRKNGAFWNGSYFCIECGKKFKIIIKSEDMETIHVVDSIQECNLHQEFVCEPKKRITGVKRQLIAQEIVSKGICNFRAENFLSNPGKI